VVLHVLSDRSSRPVKTAARVTRPRRSSQVASPKKTPKTTAKTAPPGSFPSPISTALPNSPTVRTPASAVRTVRLRPFHDYLPGIPYSELMDIAQRELSDRIDQATQCLLDQARVITEAGPAGAVTAARVDAGPRPRARGPGCRRDGGIC